MTTANENPRPLQWVDLFRDVSGDQTCSSLAAGGKTPRGCFRVTGELPHQTTIQPRNRAAALLMLEVIGEWLEDNPDGLRVLWVDAWRDDANGWTENETRDTGERFPRELLEATPRAVLAWFRRAGLLDPTRSPGRVAVDPVGDDLYIVDRGTREPLFRVEWLEGDDDA